MRAPVAQIKQIIAFTGELLLGPPCDFRKGLQELICKPKTFIELSLGLEDRLEVNQLKVLREIMKAAIDLNTVHGQSVAAYGLALWLNKLADFASYAGLMRKAKKMQGAAPKKRDDHKQVWQFSSNAAELNEEILMRNPKWKQVNSPQTELESR